MINNFKLEIIKRFPGLQRWIRYNYGLIPEKLKATDFIFGGLGVTKKVLRPDGQWTLWLPSDERQSGRRVETMACTCFSLLNVLEMLAKVKAYGEWNKSDRFSSKLSGVTRSGNSQSKVLDSVRKLHGIVNEEVWPSNIDDFSWSEFYASIPQDVVDSGFTFVNEYEVGYEAVWSTPNALKEALKYSPLYIAGFAWAYDGGFYRSYGNPNHAFVLVGYVDGQYWLAYDSYAPHLKKLAWDYKIFYPKVITLNKRGEIWNMAKIADLVKRGFKYIILPETFGEIYEIFPTELKKIEPAEWNNRAVQMSSDQKTLIGISNEYFNQLKL